MLCCVIIVKLEVGLKQHPYYNIIYYIMCQYIAVHLDGMCMHVYVCAARGDKSFWIYSSQIHIPIYYYIRVRVFHVKRKERLRVRAAQGVKIISKYNNNGSYKYIHRGNERRNNNQTIWFIPHELRSRISIVDLTCVLYHNKY